MKIMSILLAIIILNAPFQERKVEETRSYKIEEVTPLSNLSSDELISDLRLVQVICTMTKCVLPMIKPETKVLVPADQTIRQANPGKKEYHFEAPGMLSVSIQE